MVLIQKKYGITALWIINIALLFRPLLNPFVSYVLMFSSIGLIGYLYLFVVHVDKIDFRKTPRWDQNWSPDHMLMGPPLFVTLFNIAVVNQYGFIFLVKYFHGFSGNIESSFLFFIDQTLFVLFILSFGIGILRAFSLLPDKYPEPPSTL